MDNAIDASTNPIATNGVYAGGGSQGPSKTQARTRVLQPWLRAQGINVSRHTAALRPFTREEFGNSAAAPTEGHLSAVNNLMESLRGGLRRLTKRVNKRVQTAMREPNTAHLQQMLREKERAHNWVRAVERVWDFYFELFGQRQSQFGDWLLGCDRIALDCYQVAYTGLGTARSIPAPPPFSYMRTGFSPATFRRGIPLSRLGQQINPFPLIQLPYHRMVNPWTLGAVLHEVSHNLHNDLGLERAIPQAIARRLLAEGQSRFVAAVWTRWNRETFADLSGLLLGGPAVVASLMDVVGRSPAATFSYAPRAPHPTPYLRTYLSIELLRRMGFPKEAANYQRLWQRMYPNPSAGNIPEGLLRSFRTVVPLVVDTVCYQPYPTLGEKTLAQVMRFAPKEQQMIEEAGRRLAAGNDPGVVPERFLIGAARFALDQRLARPAQITENFYKELARR
ncbi:MAG: hypothetical protein ACOYNY_04145 [Caldilineaceae bacterium]